jgi:hypothetical protein
MTDQQALSELRKLFGTSQGLTNLVKQVGNARVERLRKELHGTYDTNMVQRHLGRIEGLEEFINHLTAGSADTHRNTPPDRN